MLLVRLQLASRIIIILRFYQGWYLFNPFSHETLQYFLSRSTKNSNSIKAKQNLTVYILPIITPEDPDLDILASVKDNGLG